MSLEGEVPQPNIPQSWKDFQPVWFRKTTVWVATFRAACPLKTGMGGQFCLWRGQPCSYDLCPARVFEEVEIKDVSYMTNQPDPRQELTNLRAQNNNLINEINQLKAQIEALRKLVAPSP